MIDGREVVKLVTKGIENGEITHCARCGLVPNKFVWAAAFIPTDASMQRMRYAICSKCAPILKGQFGKAATKYAAEQVEHNLGTTSWGVAF